MADPNFCPASYGPCLPPEVRPTDGILAMPVITAERRTSYSGTFRSVNPPRCVVYRQMLGVKWATRTM